MGVSFAGNTVNTAPSQPSADTAQSETLKAEANDDGLFSSSGFLETYGKGAHAKKMEPLRNEHKQPAKQSKWSPVTLWKKEA